MPQDLRYAVRLLRRSPGFALSAIATLGLALGASIAVLTVAYGVLLRPLIVPDSERVLVASVTDSHFPDSRSIVSFPRYREWRESGTAFEHLSAIARTHVDLTGDGPAERVVAQVVSDNFFDMLRVPALIGRTFDDSDAAPAPCVIAYSLWHRRFGRDPAVLGRTVRAGDLVFTVVGVMPDRFERWRGESDLWVPVDAVPSLADLRDKPGYRVYTVVGRLTRDATPAQAELQLGHAVRLAEADASYRHGARAVPLRDDLVSPGTRRLLYFLSAMVVLVWVIACANVGGMLLARNSGRASVFAVRAALGASRGRVASQLLSESLVLAVPAAATGFLMAHVLVQVLTAYAPASLAREGTGRMDLAGASSDRITSGPSASRSSGAGTSTTRRSSPAPLSSSSTSRCPACTGRIRTRPASA